MGDETQFNLGRHDEAIESLQKEMQAVRRSLGRIEATLHETKGGVRMLITVGSVGGAIGAGLVKLLAFAKSGQ